MKLRYEIVMDDGVLYTGEAVLHKQAGKAVAQKPIRVKEMPKVVKCPAALKLLWERGKFKSRLSLSDVKAALKDGGGYDFPDNTLFVALSRSAFLTQKGAKGSYTWGQKYPHS